MQRKNIQMLGLTGFCARRFSVLSVLALDELSFNRFDEGKIVAFEVAVEFESDSFSKLPPIGAIDRILFLSVGASITSFVRAAKSKSESRLKLGELKSDWLDDDDPDWGEPARESVRAPRGSIPVRNQRNVYKSIEQNIF